MKIKLMKIKLNHIKKCIKACIASYGGKYGKVNKNLFNSVLDFHVENVEGFIGLDYNNGIMYIVFRGSDGLRDWFDNFKFWMKNIRRIRPYGNLSTKIRVHTGFYNQYILVRHMIHSFIKHYSDFNKIIVTGHSLGGALATHCSVDLQYNFSGEDIACITFGSPRIGNKYFVESYNRRVQNSYRFVFEHDIVTFVPFLFLGYRNVEHRYLLKENKTFVKKVLLSYRYVTKSTDNHFPKKYEDAIKNVLIF